MEIERKYLIDIKPENLETYSCIDIEQSYLCTEPVLRIRRENEEYIFTYKSKGFLMREEHNLPLTKEAYLQLKAKIEGRIIKKKRYLIPLDNELVAEVDIFEGDLAPLTLVEVEFTDEKSANSFIAPKWFGKEVTNEDTYQNSVLSGVKNFNKGRIRY
jgi:Uncharacterized protein conserved in bacteria